MFSFVFDFIVSPDWRVISSSSVEIQNNVIVPNEYKIIRRQIKLSCQICKVRLYELRKIKVLIQAEVGQAAGIFTTNAKEVFLGFGKDNCEMLF